MWLTILAVVLLIAAIAGGIVMTTVGLPGNWVIVLAAAFYAVVVTGNSRLTLSWYGVGTVTLFAIVGELAELLAGALGVARAGGSRRAITLGLIGSVSGGIAGLVIGVPVPVVGSLIAGVLGACLGAFAGAVLGERWRGRDYDHSFSVGQAAFWGRMLGTVSKLTVSFLMALVLLFALVW
ncbi:MAG: DUF456 domain-containing protein [Planctomycetes bacterium]|nr:DUF456 domain-containing protein [Planctomycetota bacterium]